MIEEDVEAVKEICGLARRYAPDYNIDSIVGEILAKNHAEGAVKKL